MASKAVEKVDTAAKQAPVVQHKKAFKKSTYRGIELEKLIEYPMDALVKLLRARQRRRFAHGIH